eukprot:749225-Karenia_brevis.AAC.1
MRQLHPKEEWKELQKQYQAARIATKASQNAGGSPPANAANANNGQAGKTKGGGGRGPQQPQQPAQSQP